MSEFDLVILYSGGADSRLMLYFALMLKKNPYCILFDYGQKHVEEVNYAMKQLEQLQVKYSVMKIPYVGIMSGLTGDNIPGTYEGVNPMNVPARNTVFISYAYAIAESMGISEIWYGADMDDYVNKFPDCYQSYVGAMNEVLRIAPSFPIKLYAPLLGWSKQMVLDFLKNMGIRQEDIYSGYEPPQIVAVMNQYKERKENERH